MAPFPGTTHEKVFCENRHFSISKQVMLSDWKVTDLVALHLCLLARIRLLIIEVSNLDLRPEFSSKLHARSTFSRLSLNPATNNVKSKVPNRTDHYVSNSGHYKKNPRTHFDVMWETVIPWMKVSESLFGCNRRPCVVSACYQAPLGTLQHSCLRQASSRDDFLGLHAT